MKENISKRIISGVCYLIVGVLIYCFLFYKIRIPFNEHNIYRFLYRIVDRAQYSLMLRTEKDPWWVYVILSSFLLLSVATFIKNRVVFIVGGIFSVAGIIMLYLYGKEIELFSGHYGYLPLIFFILLILAFGFLFIGSINSKHSILWSVFSSITVLACLIPINMKRWGPRYDICIAYPNVYYDLLIVLMAIIAIIFSGMVFSTAEKREKIKSSPLETSGSINDTSDKIEKLVRLKALLDSGALTQEEFERKKKEIL